MNSSNFNLKSSSITENKGFLKDINVIYSFNSELNIYNSRLQFNSLIESRDLIYAVTGFIVNA